MDVNECLRTLPAPNDAAMLTFCMLQWPKLFKMLDTPTPWLDSSLKAFIRFRCFRQMQTRCSNECAVSMFLLECVARMVIIDSYDHTAPASELEQRLGEWENPLKEVELKALSRFQFRSLADFDKKLDAALDTWRSGPLEGSWPTIWAEAAYCVIFLKQAGEMTEADKFWLLKLASTSAECGLRLALDASFCRNLTPPDEDEWNVNWPATKAKYAGEELSNTVRRCVTSTRIPPHVYCVDKEAATKTEHELVAQWLGPHANSIRDDCEGGPLACLNREPLIRDATVVEMYDYIMNQKTKMAFKRLFWTSDARPSIAFERLEKYVKDSIVNPPPLVVSTWRGTFVLQRHATQQSFDVKQLYKDAGSAIFKWCKLVTYRRKGLLFGNVNIESVFHELFDIVAEQAPEVVLDQKIIDGV